MPTDVPGVGERPGRTIRLDDAPDLADELKAFDLSLSRATGRREERHRSRSRRRRTAAAGVLATFLLAAGIVLAAPLFDDIGGEVVSPATPDLEAAVPVPPPPPPEPRPAERTEPARPGDVHARLEAAERYAAGRQGEISFAVVDRGGTLRGRDEHLTFPSASVVKSMLLAAELRRLHQAGLPVDASTESVLRSMITFSDNDAATTIYSRVGDAGLNDLAERIGMTDFTVAVSWGYAEISAADMALLFSRLDTALPRSSRELGKGLLGSVIPEQSWGIPVAAKGWSARFKGGWRATDSGQLVSQVAELRRDGRQLAIAVLTDGQPTQEYGIESVEGVAKRLLRN